MSRTGCAVRQAMPLLALIFLSLNVFADGPVVMVYPDLPTQPKLERDKALWRISQNADYQAAASVPNSGGDLETVSTTSKVEYFFRTREQFVAADFSYSWKSFNWNSAPNYITDTGAYEVNILAFQELGNDDWNFVGLVKTRMEAEYNGGDIPSSASYLFGGAAEYKFSPRLKFGLGVSVEDTPLNTVRVWPMVVLHWKINQQLTLSSANGLLLAYQPDEGKRYRLDVSALYNSSYIGLHSQAVGLGITTRPIVRDTSIDLVAGFEYQLNSWLRLRAAVAGKVYSEYEFYRDKSNNYQTLRPDPSVGFSLRAMVAF